MYLSATTHKIQAVSNATATTTEPVYVASFEDCGSAGWELPMLSSEGSLSGTTDVDVVGAPAAGKTRQVKEFTIFNADTVSHTINVYKDVSGTNRPIVQAVLRSGETLIYNADNSWSIFSQAGETSVTLREYIANNTYTKPAGLKAAFVFGGGAGGGGGSGARLAAGTNRFGGGGGGGGAVVWRMLTATEIAASVAITIGVGGPGASGVVANDTNGTAGTAGTDTSFGALMVAKGGSAGGGGSTAAGSSGTGGQASACTPASGPYALTGGNGNTGATTAAANGSNGMTGASASASGAGGGGISNGNTSSTATYTGGAITNNGVSVSGGTFGQDGTSNAARSMFFHPSLIGSYGLGSGGGGGRPDDVDGGNGGDYVAGGGGGSGVLNGTVSGAGGRGGHGFLMILEFY